MKITFPHMGNAHIPIKALLQGLKLEVVTPPAITRRTLELGVKYAPEFACLPLKINLGNFIEALENGADTILMAGGWGPCRFGYYAQVERDILSDLGYKFNMVILEAPDSRLSELFQQVKSLGEKVSFFQAMRAIKFAWYKLNAVERLEKKLEYCLPRAEDKPRVEQIYDQGLAAVDQAKNNQEVDYSINSSLQEMDELVNPSVPVLKIGLIGEIYTILEPSANYDIIRQLGRLGVEITRSIYTTQWINDHLLGGVIKKSNRREIIANASPYLNYWVGGHGQETVGSAVTFAREKYHGVIQIGPLTCMPEIVAQSILGVVSQQENVPCMTLYFDEHSGIAGVSTRLEAYVDMLLRQQRAV